MNVYSIDIKICATAYIRAKNHAEAVKLLHENFGKGESDTQMSYDIRGDVSSAILSSPKLPEVSISPAVTYYGPFDPPAEGEELELDLAEELEDAE